ncbi:MAG: hypothetical protein LBB08_02265, partial [Rickettsiales bacterium]|nr:hypothetical protein [Rickettsiales bacterium]
FCAASKAAVADICTEDDTYTAVVDGAACPGGYAEITTSEYAEIASVQGGDFSDDKGHYTCAN